MTRMLRGLAAPCFGSDPMEIVELGVAAEEAGFDGFFVWDHMLFANDGQGPPIVDPWLVMAVLAARTKRVTIGPMVTPLSRRRPWVVARQTATLDILSGGRTILGVGLGSPARGDFELFGELDDNRGRAELLDESLAVLDGLWSGETFSFQGKHFALGPVRFLPRPVSRPRIPVWVGGVWPATRPMERASRWDGAVPITYVNGDLTRPSAEEIGQVRDLIRRERGTMTGYTLAVWAELAADPADLASELPAYGEAGATWWIETATPRGAWQDALRRRIAAGPGTP